ncbi:hypothetical protein AVEN_14543-1 [Araneus ventricosus]|uniref:Uncharacterized protein n=1 Tax=Araneus ventricosus TaxID=182803 RepID=A0A4Y2CFF9_ARAVE|nr:hypothetical protein AVEN_14543-1 [Araneus ventricosus]
MTQKYSNLANCKFIKLITDALSRDDRKTQRYNKFSHTQEIGEAEACTRNQQKQKTNSLGPITGVQHPHPVLRRGVEELDFLWRLKSETVGLLNIPPAVDMFTFN